MSAAARMSGAEVSKQRALAPLRRPALPAVVLALIAAGSVADAASNKDQRAHAAGGGGVAAATAADGGDARSATLKGRQTMVGFDGAGGGLAASPATAQGRPVAALGEARSRAGEVGSDAASSGGADGSSHDAGMTSITVSPITDSGTPGVPLRRPRLKRQLHGVFGHVPRKRRRPLNEEPSSFKEAVFTKCYMLIEESGGLFKTTVCKRLFEDFGGHYWKSVAKDGECLKADFPTLYLLKNTAAKKWLIDTETHGEQNILHTETKKFNSDDPTRSGNWGQDNGDADQFKRHAQFSLKSAKCP